MLGPRKSRPKLRTFFKQPSATGMLRKCRKTVSRALAYLALSTHPDRKQFRHPETSRFNRDLTISCKDTSGKYYNGVARTTFDTGSRKNYITQSCLQREDMPHALYDIPREVARSLNDAPVLAHGEIWLRFASIPGDNKHETALGKPIWLRNKYESGLFYILNDRNFDLIVGEETITDKDLLRMWDPFLANFGNIRPPSQAAPSEHRAVETERAIEQKSNDHAKQADKEKVRQAAREQVLRAQQARTS